MAVTQISGKADCILGAQQLGLQQIESQDSLKEATKWPVSVHVHETRNLDCVSYHEAWGRSKRRGVCGYYSRGTRRYSYSDTLDVAEGLSEFRLPGTQLG